MRRSGGCKYLKECEAEGKQRHTNISGIKEGSPTFLVVVVAWFSFENEETIDRLN